MSTPQSPFPQQQPAQQQQQPAQAPQYAPPQVAPGWAAPPAGQYSPPQQELRAPAGRFNVPGIIALALVIVSTLISVMSPVFYRSALSAGQSLAPITGVVQVLQAILLLVALGLAIFGVLLAGADRWRWAAIGALVSSSISAAAMLLSIIVNLFSAAFPY